MAQPTLPGMKSVEVKANMVDGFYTGSARDCGYSFGVYYSVFKGNNAHEWTFGGEYLQTYKPYGENGRIPVAEFRLLPDMKRSTGERRCCLTEQRSTTRTLSSMVELLTFRPTSTSRIE